jgi:hypothetical protein
MTGSTDEGHQGFARNCCFTRSAADVPNQTHFVSSRRPPAQHGSRPAGRAASNLISSYP